MVDDKHCGEDVPLVWDFSYLVFKLAAVFPRGQDTNGGNGLKESKLFPVSHFWRRKGFVLAGSFRRGEDVMNERQRAWRQQQDGRSHFIPTQEAERKRTGSEIGYTTSKPASSGVIPSGRFHLCKVP